MQRLAKVQTDSGLVEVLKIQTDAGLIEVNFRTKMLEDGARMSREVTLYVDGQKCGTKSVAHEMRRNNVHLMSTMIWRNYQNARRGNLVVRSGLGLCGCYESYDPKAAPNLRHQESDTEHAAGCIEVLRCLRLYYPDLLTPELWRRADMLLKWHDIGENFYGDHPDDGSQNVAEKNQVELMEFALNALNLPEPTRGNVIGDFVRFQHPWSREAGAPEEMEMAQLARAIDKLETIMSPICYEKDGIRGNLAYKKQYFGEITEQDKYFVELAGGDDSIVASWLAHAVYNYHACYGFAYVLDIVRAAIIDVRGEWFPWFDEFCRECKIPLEHVTHPFLAKNDDICNKKD